MDWIGLEGWIWMFVRMDGWMEGGITIHSLLWYDYLLFLLYVFLYIFVCHTHTQKHSHTQPPTHTHTNMIFTCFRIPTVVMRSVSTDNIA